MMIRTIQKPQHFNLNQDNNYNIILLFRIISFSSDVVVKKKTSKKQMKINWRIIAFSILRKKKKKAKRNQESMKIGQSSS